ncbi:hypothetical protein SAMN02745202_02508 [Segatella oulorum]|uniref:Uncharacterized protein n=1 Tax=Segatella oulorum TaxID=28136 RepID=A0A1T4RZH5_9BACT|nr:hypothetical protein SAMN02745202_02508 [Segatella oulorum]
MNSTHKNIQYSQYNNPINRIKYMIRIPTFGDVPYSQVKGLKITIAYSAYERDNTKRQTKIG